MKKVDFIFFDAGGGHRSAANALKSVVEEQGRQWQVRLFNLQEELDSLDIFKKITGIRFQDLYNHMLAKGWTLGSEYLLPPMHGIIRLFHRRQVKMLTEIWRRDRPDMVVSVVPNFNRALFQSVQAANSSTPFVTILTDFADYPPHFWLEEAGPLRHLRDRARVSASDSQRQTTGKDIPGLGHDLTPRVL